MSSHLSQLVSAPTLHSSTCIANIVLEGVTPGDSGSWVVDADTMTLLGHVVASDIFGDVYVVPIAQSFTDIRRKLHALRVYLPPDGNMIRPPPRDSEDNISPQGRTSTKPDQVGGPPKTSTSRDAAEADDEIIPYAISVRNLALSTHENATVVRGQSVGAFIAIRNLQTLLKYIVIEVQDPGRPWRSAAERVSRVLKDIELSLTRFRDIVLEYEYSVRVNSVQAQVPEVNKSEISSAVRDLEAQETRLEIVLDEIQLGSLPPYPAKPPASNNIPRLIRYKVDAIASRVSTLQHDDGDRDTMGELWQTFYDELLHERFSKEVLDQNKVG